MTEDEKERGRGLSRRFIFRNFKEDEKKFRDGPIDEQKNSMNRSTKSEK